jgi:phosphoglycerate dehydrogenase-like enzyme
VSGLNLLVISDPLAKNLRVLERLPDETHITVSNTADVLMDGAPDADVVLVGIGGQKVLRELWPSLRRARWLHSLSAGVENLLFPELIESNVTVTNGRGVYKRSLAEFALAAMLFFAKDLGRMKRSQQAGRWDPFDVEMLDGATLGVVGFGEIGRATASLAKPFGMRVLALKRRSLTDPLADQVYVSSDRMAMISESDYLLVSAALTQETRDLVGEAEIAAMKPYAVVINVGRGAVVNESALIRALEEHRIRGAALDVFNEEPLPDSHPFWHLDNVLLSPHTADHTATWLDETMQFFVEEFQRFANGEPLVNIVDKKAGY